MTERGSVDRLEEVGRHTRILLECSAEGCSSVVVLTLHRPRRAGEPIAFSFPVGWVVLPRPQVGWSYRVACPEHEPELAEQTRIEAEAISILSELGID